MVCPDCGSENVTISMEQVASKTKKHGNGFGGHMNNAARASLLCVPSVCPTFFGKRAKEPKKRKSGAQKYACAKTAEIPGKSNEAHKIYHIAANVRFFAAPASRRHSRRRKTAAGSPSRSQVRNYADR